jgi:UDPglucose--hexose-1-phosphate uridylyltransferase
VAPSDRKPDTPGWRIRVVPNLYPALDHQEVVVHSPRHVRSITELAGEELSLIAEVWRARAAEARSGGFAYVQVLINEGREAGASLPHSHSQLIWLREPPPITGQEESPPNCKVCNHLAAEMREGTREIAHSGLVDLYSRYAARVPYEMLAAISEYHLGDAFEDDDFDQALPLIASVLRRLRELEGPVPVNVWLYTAPFGTEGHWRFEIVPRLTVFAGLELGAGLYVNWLAPEEAAARLRI